MNKDNVDGVMESHEMPCADDSLVLELICFAMLHIAIAAQGLTVIHHKV